MEIIDGEEGSAGEHREDIKTKIMVCVINLDLLKKSGKDPCGICQTGIGSYSNFCGGCLCWIHKKCSGTKGPLRTVSDFRWA